MSFLKTFALAGLAPLALAVAVGLYIQPVSGDLTRMMNLPERSWGWNALPPVVGVQANPPASECPVIVFGDSFSGGNVWQSATTEDSGLPLMSFDWLDIPEPCALEAAIMNLKERFPGVKYCVVQSVEREFLQRFAQPQIPGWKFPRKIESRIIAHPGVAAPRRILFDRNHLLPDVVYATQALLSEGKSYRDVTREGRGVVAPLKRNDLFSNRRSAWLLSYDRDLEREQWPEQEIKNAVENIKQTSERLREAGIEMIVAIVPNKLTAYTPFLEKSVLSGQQTDLWQALKDASVNTVDLKSVFQKEISSKVDFYMPNDTHLGMHGYIAMGNEIARCLLNTAQGGCFQKLPQTLPNHEYSRATLAPRTKPGADAK